MVNITIQMYVLLGHFCVLSLKNLQMVYYPTPCYCYWASKKYKTICLYRIIENLLKNMVVLRIYAFKARAQILMY